MKIKKNKAVLSRQALKNNITQIKMLAPQSKVLAMVKANAYGHGILGVSEVIAPLVDGLAVATIEEGLTLRLAHPTLASIVVMQGVLYLDELILAIEHKLTLVLHHPYELALLEQYLENHRAKINAEPLSVWAQIDVGMHRLGFLPTEIPTVLSRLTHLQNQGLIYLIGWMTHFSASDNLTDPSNQMQVDLYQEHVFPLLGEKSMANSAAIMQMPESHQDWIRPGLLLYGASPIKAISAKSLGFKPVMKLSSLVLAIRAIPAGTRIGYNGIWEAKRDTIIATIGIGYGDGYPRSIQENTPVWINHQCFPIVGRVSMDMIMADITEHNIHQPVSIGDKVELWGEHITVEEIAQKANTLPYELFCQLTHRVHFSWET